MILSKTFCWICKTAIFIFSVLELIHKLSHEKRLVDTDLFLAKSKLEALQKSTLVGLQSWVLICHLPFLMTSAYKFETQVILRSNSNLGLFFFFQPAICWDYYISFEPQLLKLVGPFSMLWFSSYEKKVHLAPYHQYYHEFVKIWKLLILCGNCLIGLTKYLTLNFNPKLSLEI